MKKLILSFLILLFTGHWLHLDAQDARQTLYLQIADSVDNAIRQERWQDAESFINQALRLEPANFNNALLLSNLGLVQTYQGKYPQALQSYELGLSIAPKSTVLLTNRARTLMEMDRPADAIKDLSAVLSIDPSLDWERKMRGMLLLHTGQTHEAEKDFARLLETAPNDPDILYGMAQCYLQEGDRGKAIDFMTQALAKAPEDEELLFTHALLCLEEGRIPEASSDISEAIRLYPDAADFYVLRAYLKKLSYQQKDAKADLDLAKAKGADLQLIQLFFPSGGK